jgi:4-hydroxybenzoyl-CoA thioesterase/acyl-CoA thioester hydrolase
MPTIELKRRVRWADADPAFRINFPRYFEYFEEGESELLRARGVSLLQQGSEYGFPRVHAECTFKRVLALDAEFVMRVSVGNVGRSSIRFEFQFFDEANELAAEGSMTIVATKDGKSVELPAALRAALTD